MMLTFSKYQNKPKKANLRNQIINLFEQKPFFHKRTTFLEKLFFYTPAIITTMIVAGGLYYAS